MATLEQLGIALQNADKAGDEAAARQLAAEIRRQQAAGQQQPSVGLGEDLARTVPSALKRGTEQTIGTIGDVAGMGGAGAGKLASMFVQPDAAKTTGDAVSEAIGTALNPVGSAVSKFAQVLGYGDEAKRAYMPTSETIKQDVEAAVPASKSLNYNPQTTAGKMLHTGIEFGTGAIAGGEARIPAVLRRVAEQLGIGMASEGAGQLAEGTPLEPYARVGTGLGLSALTLSPLLRKGPVAAPEPDWIGGKPSPPAGASAGQATGSKPLQALETGVGAAADLAKAKAGQALYGGLLTGHLLPVAASLAAPIGGNMLLRSGPVQRMLMSAPETDRAALTAIISGQQARKQGQEGWP